MSNNKQIDLCILAPCYNEEKSLPLFYPALKNELDSIKKEYARESNL